MLRNIKNRKTISALLVILMVMSLAMSIYAAPSTVAQFDTAMDSYASLSADNEIYIPGSCIFGNGHTIVDDTAVAPTCKDTGLTAGSHCSVCGSVIVKQTVVPATGEHTPSDWIVDVQPTVEAEGSQHKECTACGETLETESIPKLEPTTTPVTGVTLNVTEATLATKKTLTLTATVAPSDATNQNVTWSSDNEAVATVVDGVVTGVAKGTANITVTTEDGGKTATCVVTVKVLGDVNGDGNINRADQMLVARKVANPSLTNVDTFCANVNGDANINRADQMLLARKVANPALEF